MEFFVKLISTSTLSERYISNLNCDESVTLHSDAKELVRECRKAFTVLHCIKE